MKVKKLVWKGNKDCPDIWVFSGIIQGLGFYNIYKEPTGNTYTVSDGLFGEYMYEVFKTLIEAKDFCQTHFEKRVSELIEEG